MSKNKQIVLELLQFFKNFSGNIFTGTKVYSYRDVANAIEGTIEEALEDGYQKGFAEADASNYFEVRYKGDND